MVVSPKIDARVLRIVLSVGSSVRSSVHMACFSVWLFLLFKFVQLFQRKDPKNQHPCQQRCTHPSSVFVIVAAKYVVEGKE
jgi:hypothetical protein